MHFIALLQVERSWTERTLPPSREGAEKERCRAPGSEDDAGHDFDEHNDNLDYHVEEGNDQCQNERHTDEAKKCLGRPAQDGEANQPGYPDKEGQHQQCNDHGTAATPPIFL